MKWLPLLLFFSTLTAENPWGKDAELLSYPKICHAPCSTPLFGPLSEALIAFHQNVISPADGPRSHYFPSSSQYTLDAIRKYGFFVGFTLGCDRLMRENNDPWVYTEVTLSDKSTLKWNPIR